MTKRINSPRAGGHERARKRGDGPNSAAEDLNGQPLVIDTTWNMIQKRQLVLASEFQCLMGWTSRRSVPRALAERRIFALEYDGQPYIPTFFANTSFKRRHLAAVSQALSCLPGGAKLQFFLARNAALGGDTPFQALAAGRLDKVLDLAAAYAET